MPKILITGAGGFLGQFLARALLADPSNKVVLSDVVDIPIPKGSAHPQNASTIKADLVKAPQSVITPDLDVAYLFHGIMSAGSEANLPLGLAVNLDATKAVLEAIRTIRPGLRVIYSSSGAVYGRPLPDVITEKVLPTPEGSYGTQKFMCELLINDYTRRGIIEGFSMRFPTISVRPGAPSAAASSWVSGIIREPLNGEECMVPVEDRSFPTWVCSPSTLIRNLVHVLSVPVDALPMHQRTINAPGLLATVQDMLDALAKVGGEDKLQFVKEKHDDALANILYTWAFKYDNSLALSLGYKPDSSFEQAVREYVQFLEDEKRWNVE